MGQSVSFGDENFKQQMAEFMQQINPKPIGSELEALKKKYEDERAAYIERRKRGERI